MRSDDFGFVIGVDHFGRVTRLLVPDAAEVRPDEPVAEFKSTLPEDR